MKTDEFSLPTSFISSNETYNASKILISDTFAAWVHRMSERLRKQNKNVPFIDVVAINSNLKKKSISPFRRGMNRINDP